MAPTEEDFSISMKIKQIKNIAGKAIVKVKTKTFQVYFHQFYSCGNVEVFLGWR